MAAKARLVSLIPIRKMNRAIAFYTKALGGKVQYRGEGPMRDSWASLQVGGGDVWLIRPETREPRKLAYTTFLVTDIRSFVKDLMRKRVKFQRATRMSPKTRIEGPIAFEAFGASAFFKDSEGNLLMVWQTMS
jgi:predicted enzyme related to lactoylglutathione lyase